MKTCVYCGAILDDGDRFCGNCGKPILSNEGIANSFNFEKHNKRRSGVLLTNSMRLAQLLNVPQSIILGCLQNYIKRVFPYISYSLIDLSNSSINDWRECHRLLFKDNYLSVQNEMGYLFIIGGDEVIPVPSMKNCMPSEIVKMVPTDILYGYTLSLFGSKEEDINSLLNSRQKYHVGRLPLAVDSTFDVLQSYLDRAVEYMKNGLPVQMAYAQSDPHWKQVSMKVISELDKSGILPEINAPASVLHDKVFLTPYITCDTIDNAFNSYGNLFYFNMHGSDNPNTPQFLGQGLEEDPSFYAGIAPQTLSTAKFDNVVVTEACYGGKFIGLKTNQSMLLTSISNSTMLYLGSSVTAYGIIDKSLNKGADINSADVMVKEFISGLMQGYSAGESVQKARCKLLNITQKGSAISNLLTIYEFSLYGDPALKARFSIQPTPHSRGFEDFAGMTSIPTLQVEQVYGESSNSILSVIRSFVDSSLQALNADIQKELADFGIQTRKLTSISRVRFGMQSQHMFTYQTDNGTEPIVVVDDQSQTKTLLMPKGTVEQYLNDARRLSINYANIFHSYTQRFGLISSESDDQPMLEGNNSQLKTVYIDKRIEPKSKRQIKTFNAVLDQVYRPEMQNSNIASLSTKECDYDFSVLVNPLSILLETELRAGLMPLISKRGTCMPTEKTFGKMVDCFIKNKHLLAEYGINNLFLSLLREVPAYRNPASHSGGMNEQRFLEFYGLFIKIVSSSQFIKMLELKQNYK